jgi:hypothetical protein
MNGHEKHEGLVTGELMALGFGGFSSHFSYVKGCCSSVMTIGDISCGYFCEFLGEKFRIFWTAEPKNMISLVMTMDSRIWL